MERGTELLGTHRNPYEHIGTHMEIRTYPQGMRKELAVPIGVQISRNP